MLYDLYDSLCRTIPKDEDVLIGQRIAYNHPIWLSIDSESNPAVLLPARADDLRPDIKLRSMEILFSRNCTVQAVIGHQPHVGCYSVIRLKENDRDIVRLFTKIVEERFCQDTLSKNNAEIAANFQEVAALFSKIDVSTNDLIGLWGELYLIEQADNLVAMVQAWSLRKTAKYDFVTDHFVLDVKTTLSPSRKHRFSLEQLRPKGNVQAYVASISVTEVESGRTVGAMVDSISAQIDNFEIRNSFLHQCLMKGGKDIYRSELVLHPYPEEAAIPLFRVEDIPAPEVSNSDPIDNVRFDVDLSSIAPLDNMHRSKVLRFS